MNTITIIINPLIVHTMHEDIKRERDTITSSSSSHPQYHHLRPDRWLGADAERLGRANDWDHQRKLNYFRQSHFQSSELRHFQRSRIEIANDIRGNSIQ